MHLSVSSTLQPRPFCSVVVPTYERPAALRRCLAALARQDYSPDRFEVIVVDDGGTADLSSVVESIRARVAVTLLRQANAGPAAARNHGARAARGSLLAFTDDDCAPALDWLSCLSTALNDRPGTMAGGHTVNALPHNPYASASQLLNDYLYTSWSAGEGPAFFASNNMAMPAESFWRIGGFAPSFPHAAGEDRDFCTRWRAAGYSLQFVPEGRVLHHHALTLRSFWQQHRGYGRGAYHVHRLHAGRSARQESASPRSIAFYRDLLLHPLRTLPPRMAIPQFVLFGLSQVATAVGLIAEWRAQ